jgi:hypothetical protein
MSSVRLLTHHRSSQFELVALALTMLGASVHGAWSYGVGDKVLNNPLGLNHARQAEISLRKWCMLRGAMEVYSAIAYSHLQESTRSEQTSPATRRQEAPIVSFSPHCFPTLTLGPLLQPADHHIYLHPPGIPSSITLKPNHNLDPQRPVSPKSGPSLSPALPSFLIANTNSIKPIYAIARSPRDQPIGSTTSTMPTPDETSFPPSPPIDIPARSSFASCPPEEEREAREESDDDGEEPSVPADHAIAQEPTPEPDALEGASASTQSQSKDKMIEDATVETTAHTPTPTASPDVVAPEGEMQAQAASNPHASVSFPPQYLDFAPNKERVSVVVHDMAERC